MLTELNMRNNGKVLSKTWQERKNAGYVSARRVSAEEAKWTEQTGADGKQIDPDMHRVTIEPPGSRYQTAVVKDTRKTNVLRDDGTAGL